MPGFFLGYKRLLVFVSCGAIVWAPTIPKVKATSPKY